MVETSTSWPWPSTIGRGRASSEVSSSPPLPRSWRTWTVESDGVLAPRRRYGSCSAIRTWARISEAISAGAGRRVRE
ncbi:hypothetical protein [Lentzea kentuckyensis]|uniref:hypothetical protein n=1 Tax=Lentzea kentuckyensis TaxID=360086 RepID=UPI001302409C|nr:hypothetical protein [Lentzea kentuckyensis]